MTAYWISFYREILDEERVDAYAELAGPAIQASGGRVIARGLPAQTYESGIVARTVVIEFASVEDARRAHDGPEYQAALAKLDGGAVREIRIVPGLE